MRFSLSHRRRRVFSLFDFRSSFSRFSDFIEASRAKIQIIAGSDGKSVIFLFLVRDFLSVIIPKKIQKNQNLVDVQFCQI